MASSTSEVVTATWEETEKKLLKANTCCHLLPYHLGVCVAHGECVAVWSNQKHTTFCEYLCFLWFMGMMERAWSGLGSMTITP